MGIPENKSQLFFTDRHATLGRNYLSFEEVKNNPSPPYDDGTMVLIDLEK